MEMNGQLDLASEIIEKTGCSLFLTGKAGTGKTTFLRRLRTSSRKRMVVTAPTGIAAINAGGMTLHSFFQLDFGPFVPGARRDSSGRRQMAFSKEKIRIIRGLDLLVIDEISMVRSDMLDAVDDVLRRFRDRTLPFGGVQLLLIGDLQQLPPVVVEPERRILEANYRSPYFFDSHALEKLDYITVELQKVYRQNDSRFLDILNAVRDNRADRSTLDALNSRHIPGFSPRDSEGYVRLTTHNRLADEINRGRLDALPGKTYTFRASVKGNFPESSYPAAENLELKEGAQVMFIKNDTGSDRSFFNGMLGRVTAIDSEGVTVTPADGGDPVAVEPMEWENVKFTVNEETKEITEQLDGVFRQLPLKTAWAMTIHKSQGLTFDKAIIDASASFTHGQTYVALSRCRSLEGLVLDRPLAPAAIITDPTVTQFIESHRTDEIDPVTIESMRHSYIMSLAGGMFNFNPLFSALEGVARLLQENFMKLYPSKVREFTAACAEMRSGLVEVGDRFRGQMRQLDTEASADRPNPRLMQRIKDASNYFLDRLRQLRELVAGLPSEHDNRRVAQKLTDRMDLFENMADIREALLETFSTEDFDTELYLDIKARGAFKAAQTKKKSRRKETTEQTADNLNPALLDRLTEWRRGKAAEAGMPAYTVCTTKTLLAVSNHLPADSTDLLMMPGIGPATAQKYGDEILGIVAGYKQEHPESERLDAAAAHKKKPRAEREKKQKPERGETRRTSLAMFMAGKEVDEIASERGLKPATIVGHLLAEADLSDTSVTRRLVPSEARDAIGSYFDSHPTLPPTYTEIMEDIDRYTGYEPEFLHLKIMCAIHGRQPSAPQPATD